MTRPLSVPVGRRREAGGGEQRPVVTQLLGYMRKWLLFPSSSPLRVFHRHQIKQDFLLCDGNEWSASGSNSTACKGWDLPRTVLACPAGTQSPSLDVPRRQAPFLALDTWGQSPSTQARKEAHAGVRYPYDIQWWSRIRLGLDPALRLGLGCELGMPAVCWSYSWTGLYETPAPGGWIGNLLIRWYPDLGNGFSSDFWSLNGRWP